VTQQLLLPRADSHTDALITSGPTVAATSGHSRHLLQLPWFCRYIVHTENVMYAHRMHVLSLRSVLRSRFPGVGPSIATTVSAGQ
jgi:hypothetical protein